MAAANFFAPPLPEQLHPYTSVKQVDIYLALVNKGTHLSLPKGASKLPSFIVSPGQREGL